VERDRDAREAALNAFLDAQVARGFRIETRSATQAVIERRTPLLSVLRRFGGLGVDRQVVSVDEHGKVTATAAERIRW
jgi:hypothetical protein